MDHPETPQNKWMRGNFAIGVVQLLFVIGVIAAAVGLSAALNNQVHHFAFAWC